MPLTKLIIVNRALSLLGEYRISTLTEGDLTENGQEQVLARKINDQYDLSRDLIMSKYRWSFARTQVLIEPAWVAIDSVADVSGEVRIRTASPHGRTTGERVVVKDTEQSDGHFNITVIDTDDFTLDDSVWSSGVVAGSFALAPLFGHNYRFAFPSDALRINTVNGKHAKAERSRWTISGREIFTNTDTARVVYTKQVTDVTLYPAEFVECLVKQLAADLAVPVVGTSSVREDILREMLMVDIPNARRSNAIDKKVDMDVENDSAAFRTSGGEFYPGVETEPLY